jgi:tRNA U34 5-methylaminomethyl-2-thiouridine-forming methyltransferase MnmC
MFLKQMIIFVRIETMQTEIITTEDGTKTLYVPELDEHYHSVYGAMQESIHVYIEAGLKKIKKKNIRILEIGFGTGLNALLSLHYAENNEKTIDYKSVELYPLNKEIIEQLNYSSFFPENYHESFMIMHICRWNKKVMISEKFSLNKIETDFLIYQPDNNIDLIYFDAFGPDKQPEMWTEDLFLKLFDCLNPGGVFTTYTCKGQVKRNLKNAGFKVELIPGPPGKREMIRATK